MKLCNLCHNRAAWECDCSQNLCNEHMLLHLKAFPTHKLSHVKNFISPETRDSLRYEIKRRIEIINFAKSQINRDTKQIIAKIRQIHETVVKNLESLKLRQLELVDKQYFTNDEFDKVDDILEKSFEYIPLKAIPSLDEISACYQRKLLIEVPSKESYRRFQEVRQSLALEMIEKRRKFLELHGGGVNSVILTSNGNFIVSGSNDKCIRVWDYTEKALAFTLLGHEGSITCLALTVDPQVIVSGSLDSSIRIWNLSTRKQIGILNGHEKAVQCITVCNEHLLISGSNDKTIRLWNLKTNLQIGLLNEHKDSITCLAVRNDSTSLYSGSWDLTLKIWNIRDMHLENIITSMKAVIMSIVFLYNNEKIALGYGDGSIIISDINFSNTFELKGHTAAISSLLVIENNWNLISASDDSTICFWDLQKKSKLSKFTSHSREVRSICLTSDRNFLISGSLDRLIIINDLRPKSFIGHLFSGNKSYFLIEKEFNYIMAVSAHSRFILYSNDANESLYLWTLETQKDEKIYIKDKIKSAEFMKDPKYAVVTSCKKELMLLDTSTKSMEVIFKANESISCMKVTNSLEFVITGGYDGTIGIWNLRANRLERLLKEHVNEVYDISISQNNLYIISCSSDLTVRRWSIREMKSVVIEGFRLEVKKVAFVEGDNFIMCSLGEQQVIIWEIDNNKEKFIISAELGKKLVKRFEGSKHNIYSFIENQRNN